MGQGVTTLVLALIEFGQGVSIACFQGLEVIKRSLNKTERQRERAKRFEDQARQAIERIAG